MSLLRTHGLDLPVVAPKRPDAATSAEPVRPREIASTALPAVALVGGEANALSVARELGRQGIKVYALSTEETCVRHSRYCEWIRVPSAAAAVAAAGPPPPHIASDFDPAANALLNFLQSSQAEFLHGSLLIACSDAALKLFAEHRDALLRRYKLELANPAAQLAMLDKLRTYEIARASGVDVPKFWAVSGPEHARTLRHELVFPLMVKPRLSHVFERQFGTKHVIAATCDELLGILERLDGSGCEVMLVEVIPGGDDRLASYFTYLDEDGEPLCHYTKRVVRRYPVGMGATCYHITGDVSEIVGPSLRLLAAAGMRGMANVEFKRDPRNERYKLIECNARFVASNALVAASGPRFATFVYQRAAGRSSPLAPPQPSRTMRQWDPLRDFAAFLELRRAGQITLWQWLRSVARRQTLPYFSWSDPGPTLSRLLKALRRALPDSSKG